MDLPHRVRLSRSNTAAFIGGIGLVGDVLYNCSGLLEMAIFHRPALVLPVTVVAAAAAIGTAGAVRSLVQRHIAAPRALIAASARGGFVVARTRTYASVVRQMGGGVTRRPDPFDVVRIDRTGLRLSNGDRPVLVGWDRITEIDDGTADFGILIVRCLLLDVVPPGRHRARRLPLIVVEAPGMLGLSIASDEGFRSARRRFAVHADAPALEERQP